MTNDELERIIVGDVLKTPSGDYRVVREVSTGPKRGPFRNKNYYFVFAIRHCSWTGRADTYKCRSEIKHWERTGLRVKLNSEIDEQFFDDLKHKNRFQPVLSCCSVRGIP